MDRAQFEKDCETVRARRPDGGARARIRAAGYDPDQITSQGVLDEIRERMGTNVDERNVHWNGNSRVFPVISKEQARANLAARAARTPWRPPSR